jgi:PAS domain S-box-containing protein
MLGYAADELVNKTTPAEISDPLEVIARAKTLSLELGEKITPGFEALVFKASRGIEDIYELTYIRKDGSRFPAVVSVTALRDAHGAIIGYLLIGTDNTARKKAEEALLKAGALQSAIFNSANFSSIATDAKGVIQIFNVGAERMLGYAAADVMNKITPADISDPQEVIARAKALSAELKTSITPGFEALVFKASRGIEDIYELTYIRKDGSRFPAVVSVTALRDAHGAIIGYLLIGTDNTARKKAEEALLKAGALQSAIFNSANFSSIATDAKGVIQIFNVGAERMLGYAAADVMNKITPADISDPQEVIARAKALSAELKTSITPGFEALVFKASRGIEDIYELTYIRKDGSRFPAVVSVTALRDAHGAIIGYLLIGTDNTARKQVEAEQKVLDQRLRDQQFYTRSLIESNIDALMTTDAKGIISDVNKQMEALTACTRDELIGAPFKNYFTDPELAEAGINQVLAEGKVTNYELSARARDGRVTVVSYNASTFYDRERRLQGVFAAARDITVQKRLETAQKTLEEQLRRKNDELEEQSRRVQEANRLKSEFLANMSHELRTPLNGIIGFSEILHNAKAGAINDQQKEYLGDILTSGRHLLQLINDVLDLSKVEAGKMEFKSEEIDLVKLVGEVRDIVRTMTAQKRISLVVDISPSVTNVRGDNGKLKQVLYNYLSNALKFTPDEGNVLIRINLEGEDSFRLEVTDTGIGIPEEGISRLFVEFQQLDSTMSKKHQGTGLGLALTKRIVEAQGGRVGVVSAPGKGSTFFVVLPLRASGNSDEDFSATTAANSRRPGASSILVIEDDAKERAWLVKTLSAAGYSIEIAVSGAQAKDLCSRKRFDAVTLDLLLPDMNGSDVLKALRAGGPNQDTPVIVMTVVPDKKALAAYPIHDYLTKPVSVEILRGSLARANLTPHEQRTILVVDDDPIALKQMEVWLKDLGYKPILKDNAQDGLDAAELEHPALIVVDLIMPGLDGFAFLERFRTAAEGNRTPVIVWTSKDLSKDELRSLKGTAQAVVRKGEGAADLLAQLNGMLKNGGPHGR